MIKVQFKGKETTEDKIYPDGIQIIGDGHSFWGYTPFDRFVIPLEGKIEISCWTEPVWKG